MTKLDSLNRPNETDKTLIGKPFQRVQCKLFYAGVRTELISEHVNQLFHDFDMSAIQKSENLKDRIQVLCTKKIIPIDIASNNYDVDPNTIREISFEEVEKRVKPVFKGEDPTFIGPEPELAQTGERKIVTFNPTPFRENLPKKEENNILLPILGFATVGAAIFAFN